MRSHPNRDDLTGKKFCPSCQEWRPFALFGSYTRNGKRYLRTYCRECLSKKQAEDYRERSEILKGRTRTWKRENPQAPSRSREYGLRRLAKRLGVSYSVLAETNDPKRLCDICGRPPRGKRPRLHIDHDHKTGSFRGLLCSNCNHLLGHAADNPETLRKAIEYLERRK